MVHVLLCLSAPVLFYLSAQNPGRALRLRKAGAPQAARVALVIGNGAYEEAPLRNPCHDARAMKSALEGCRFTVTLLENADKQAMEEAIRAFGDQLRDGVVGLVYYAGHGLQVKGENYLLPIGARLDREEEAPYRAVNVGLVLDRMERARNSVNILILDACRNNPLAPSWHRGGAGQGLASVDAPRGTLVSYATAPGKTAADGAGDHGAYTEALLEQLQEPGLRAEEVFKKVREKVLAASGGEQLPFESTSLVGDFYFRPPRTAEDCAREESSVLAEIARLEQALGAHVPAPPRRAELLDAQLQAQEGERQRLAQEGARRQELEGEARREEESARLAALKARLAQRRRADGDGEGGPAMKAARLELDRLEAQREALLKHLHDQQTLAMERLDQDHAALRRRLEAPRDEFETTARYQARQVEAGALPARILKERAALAEQSGARAQAQLKPLLDSIAALQARRIPVAYPVSLGTYASDLGLYPVSMAVGDGRTVHADLALDPTRARALKERGDPLRAEGHGSLVSGPELQGQLSDPVLGSIPLLHLRMAVEVGPGLAIELVAIPPGTFRMGEPGRQHEVTLTKAFWLGRCTVTQAQWEAVMGGNPSYFRGETLPVENVSWEDCQQFLARLKAKGLGCFRLPTEAEWEYSSQSGAIGDAEVRAWHEGNSGQRPHPVGQKAPNAFGLHDMTGNVWQWCQDWYGAYPAGPVTDPQGPPLGPGRVNRGGSWHDPAVPPQVRDWNGPDLRCGSVGLRLLMPCP